MFAMPIGKIVALLGLALFASTLKRPTWLGGRKWRYDSEETTNAHLQRSGRRSLGMYLMGIGAMFWVMDV